MSVHVLDGLHQAGTLPLPAIEFGLEIPAVAGPHCHDVAIQASTIVTVGIQFADEGVVAALIGWFIVGKVLVDVVANNGDEHGVVVSDAECLADLVAHLLDAFLCERHVAEVLTDIHLDGVVLQHQGAHFQVSHAHVFGQFALHDALHDILLLLGERHFLCLHGQGHRRTNG